MKNALRDLVHGGFLGLHVHADRLIQDGRSQRRYILGHGGGEEKSLSFLRQKSHDTAHVTDKPHVEHTIRFIQYDNLHPVQVQISLVLKIQETAGSGCKDVHAAGERLDLRILAYAAEDAGADGAHPASISPKALVYLSRQLSSRSHDEHADEARLGPRVRLG